MELVCPSCASSVGVPAPGGASACPRCGWDLALAAADPCASDPGLARLGLELREAFGAGAFGLDAPRSTNLGAAPTVLLRTAAMDRGPDAPGARLGDFEIIDTLGRGGMGVVYRARQLSLNREVALKVLPPFARRQRAAVARFRRESQAAARLHHTNIVPIYAQGEHDDRFYYAMELIDGESLDTALRDDSSVVSLTLRPSSSLGSRAFAPGGRVADPEERPASLNIAQVPRGRNDFRRIARLLAEVADALDHAHQSGVIHRDIKPQNLLLGRDGRLHVTDFGLAHLMDQPHLTITGEIMGTPAYMSPEQVSAAGDSIDPRTDIYSLGVTLYELLTLRRPFEGHTREQVMSRIAASEPRAPRAADPRIPRDLETICLRALEKVPGRRYPAAGEMAADLRRFADDLPIRTRRVTPMGKAIKWVQRHKALSSAVAASAAVVVLLAVMSAAAVSFRRGEADRLIQAVHGRLVFLDYRKVEGLAADLDRAGALGGREARVAQLRGLVAMQDAADRAAPIELFKSALNTDPGDAESLYLLAWAQWRADKRQDFAETYRRAEALGEPVTAAGWLFRGLAVQFQEPIEAIESYQRARDLRSRTGDIFPQATLHLARARNQLMYRTRDVTGFEPAKRALEELVENRLYDVYPYYLLSIAHRLAGEIYTDSEGVRIGQADEYFRAALDWARKGQALPGVHVERALTAEAECHESMGDFAAAAQARTAALDAATEDRYRWEALHYRWRLYFWMGRHEDALADLAQLPGFDREKSLQVQYLHFYPMLVLADSGRTEEALAHARAIALEAPNDAHAVIWSAAALRWLGRNEEAVALLADRLEQVDFSGGRLVPPQDEAWVRAIYAFVMDRAELESLLALTGGVDSHWKLTGEAYFHAGVMRLSVGDRADAQRAIEQAYRSFDDQTRYTYHAQILRVKWKQDASWPRVPPFAGEGISVKTGS